MYKHKNPEGFICLVSRFVFLVSRLKSVHLANISTPNANPKQEKQHETDQIEIWSYQQNRQASGAVGAQDEGLFNIRCFGWAGDEHAEVFLGDVYFIVCGVHILYDGVFLEYDRQVLGYEWSYAVNHSVLRYPDSSVLGYTQRASAYKNV